MKSIILIFVILIDESMYTLEEIDRILEKASRLEVAGKEPSGLYEPIGYMMSIGGKRIRPKLCLLAWNVLGDTFGTQVLYPAMALELFHEFTLMHDDIMDRSDTRRGHPTVYRKWDENTAILSGDVMMIMAYRYLSHAPADKLPEVLALFTETAIRICEGQQYDMDFEKMPLVTMDDYINMIGLKTAALIACPAKMGGLLGGASPAACEALYRFGWELGLAFQITDDYLDTFGDEKVFGKKIGGDIVENKKTWLLVETMRRASPEQRKSLDKLLQLGPGAREEKVAAVRAIYEELGVKEAAESEIRSYRGKALDALAAAGFPAGRTEQLVRFTDEIISRRV